MHHTPSPIEPLPTHQLTHVTGGAGADISSWLGIANKVFGMIGSGSKSGSSGSSGSGAGNLIGSLFSGKGGGLLGNLFGGNKGSSSSGDSSSSDSSASDSGGE